MTTKKVSYTQLLKEALNDNSGYDVSKTVDVTGPMTKQILGYKGDGELKTTSDAASILERYYFGNEDNQISILNEDDNVLPHVPDDNIDKTKKDIEKEVVDEVEDVTGDTPADDTEDLTEAEEAVIEKLIAEMENEDDKKDEDDDKKDDDPEKVDEGLGPLDTPSIDDDDDLQEAFKIFREEIEDDVDDEDKEIDVDSDVDKIDVKDVTV